MVKKLFLIILAALAVYLIYTQIFVRDYTRECVAVADLVDQSLMAAGYTDADVKSQYRRHLKSGNIVWVEFNKTLSRGPSDGKLMDSLTSMFSKLKGYSIEKKKISSAEEGIFIYGKGRVFYILKFPSAGSSPAVRLSTGAFPDESHKVSIVIDDLGYKLPPEEFQSLDIPLTYAILPMERHSKDTAEFFSARGIDYIIHFPMEPDDPFENPGRAAVLLNMDAREITHKFNNALKSVPGAFGISNHMGSAFSRSEEKMEIFLSLVKSRGLVYFDSHTSEKSVAKKVASKIGVPIVVNQFFLDNEDTEEAIEKEVKKVLARARRKPTTIAIGHIHKKNLAAVLKKYIPEFRKAGIEFVPLKSLYRERVSR